MLTFDNKTKCPTCGGEHDCASATNGHRRPSPSDVSFCIHCGGWNAFDDDLNLRPLNEDEKAFVDSSDTCKLMKSKWDDMRARKMQ